MSPSESVSSRVDPKPRKFRSACDSCHRSKTRCSGGNPCNRCQEFMTRCTYSYSVRAGKPKGSRCRKTLERERRAAMAEESHSTPREEHAIPPEDDTNQHSATSASSLSSPLPSSESFWSPSDFLFNQTASDLVPCTDWLESSALDWLQSETVPDSTQLNSSTASSEREQPGEANRFNFDSSTVHSLCMDFPDLHYRNDDHPTELQLLIPLKKEEGECHCLSTLSGLVSRQITARDVMRYDASLVLIRDAARACITFRHCRFCPKDAGSISLVITTLQLMTGTVDRLIQHLKRRSSSETSNETDFSTAPVPFSGEDSTTSKIGAGGGPIQVQFGAYHTSREDCQEQIQVLSMLVRSGVRRMLEVCWPLWDLLRSMPCSLPPSSHGDPSSSQAHKIPDLEYNGTSLNPLEVSQVQNTLMVLQNRLCHLLEQCIVEYR